MTRDEILALPVQGSSQLRFATDVRLWFFVEQGKAGATATSLADAGDTGRSLRVVPGSAPTDGGNALKAALALASAATPGGNPKSKDNRFVIELAPGIYDLGTDSILLSPYIDLLGSGVDKTTIVSTVDASYVLSVSFNKVDRLTLKNASTVSTPYSLAAHSLTSSVLMVRNGEATAYLGRSQVIPEITDVKLSSYSGFGLVGVQSSTSTFSLSGRFTRVIGWNHDSGNLGGLFSHVMNTAAVDDSGWDRHGFIADSCLGGTRSFFGSTGSYNYGRIVNCSGGDYSFLADTASFNYGEIIGCRAGQSSFCNRTVNHGTIQGCVSLGNNSFCYRGQNHGLITGCRSGGSYAFLWDGTNYGTISGCHAAGGYSFVCDGANEGTISGCSSSGGSSFCRGGTNNGTISGCIGRLGYDFCYGGTNNGTISGCIGRGGRDFCSTGTNSGTITGCEAAATNSFCYTGDNAGLIEACFSDQPAMAAGTNSGTISNCTFPSLLHTGDNTGVIDSCKLTLSKLLCAMGDLGGTVKGMVILLGTDVTSGSQNSVSATFVDCSVRIDDPGTTTWPLVNGMREARLESCRIDMSGPGVVVNGINLTNLAQVRNFLFQLVNCRAIDPDSTKVPSETDPDDIIPAHVTDYWGFNTYGSTSS